MVKIYSNAAKIQYLYRIYMSQNKQELFSPNKCTVNGLTFEELKTIRNAIFADNATLLSTTLEKAYDINYRYDIYDHNLFIVDWTSDTSKMISSTQLTLLHLSARLGRANCIQLLLDKDANPNYYSLQNESPFLTPLHELCRGISEEESDFLKSAHLLLLHGADMEARIKADSNKQTAYEICLDIKEPDNIPASTSLWKRHLAPMPDIVRTSAADLVKDVFEQNKPINSNHSIS